jgi:hypothetical protein
MHSQVEARDEFGNLRLAGGDVVSVVGIGPGVAHFTAGSHSHCDIVFLSLLCMGALLLKA